MANWLESNTSLAQPCIDELRNIAEGFAHEQSAEQPIRMADTPEFMLNGNEVERFK